MLRAGTAKEVASVVAFLLGPEASYVTVRDFPLSFFVADFIRASRNHSS